MAKVFPMQQDFVLSIMVHRRIEIGGEESQNRGFSVKPRCLASKPQTLGKTRTMEVEPTSGWPIGSELIEMKSHVEQITCC